MTFPVTKLTRIVINHGSIGLSDIKIGRQTNDCGVERADDADRKYRDPFVQPCHYITHRTYLLEQSSDRSIN